MTDILSLLRINSWIKNIFVLFPLVFSMKLFDSSSLQNAIIACVMFCFVSSIIYIINDIKDIEKDKLHPRKKERSLASGRIKKPFAIIVIALLAISLLIIAIFLPINVLIPILIYLFLNLAYIFKLKEVFLIDSLVIAINFILRVLVGCYAIEVLPSNWIIVVTFFIAILLTFIKRKSEIIMLDNSATAHRPVLKYYSINLLDMYIYISATITILAYILYTIDNQVIETFGTNNLLYSSIFVIIGVFRFLFLSNNDKYQNEGDPTSLILKDIYLQITFALWAIFIIGIIYFS